MALPSPAVPLSPEPGSTSGESAANPQVQDRNEADRRVHKRHSMSEVAFITKVRLKYGPAVSLIDLSTGGIQIETVNFRLQPGSVAVVELSGREGDLAVPSQVLRCQLVRLLPEPVYRAALVFRQALDFKTLSQEGVQPAPPAELNPVLEQANLRHVLRGLSLPGVDTDEDSKAAIDPLVGAVGTALATLETPAGRRAGSALSFELAALFKAVAEAIEQGPTPRALVAAIEEHLRQVVPARTIRLADGDNQKTGASSEAILLSVPDLGPGGPVARVAVEFPDGCEPLELHFQLLKAGMPIVALARELGRLNGFDTPLEIRAPQRLPAGWNRIVIRYNSGDLLKGFTHNFLPTKGFVHVMREPVVAPDNRVAVPFTDLKAIFFVKDLEGNAGHSEAAEIDPGARGRKVAVTFRDGERLVGTTVNYSSDAPGFFIQPADPKSNNQRVFVVARAIESLKFL